MQRTTEHPAFLTTLAILRNLVKTVHFNLFIVHQLTVLTIFTLSDTNTTARPLLSPSLVLQQCLSHCSIAAIGVGSKFQRVSPLSWQEMWRPADRHGAGEGLGFCIYIWILRQQQGRVSSLSKPTPGGILPPGRPPL